MERIELILLEKALENTSEMNELMKKEPTHNLDDLVNKAKLVGRIELIHELLKILKE